MIEKLKNLRAETGAPLKLIKQALEQAGGDVTKAKDLLLELGHDAVAGRAGRQVTSGVVEAVAHMGKIGAVVAVNCETDFVARNADFKHFVHEIALQIIAANPKNVDELLAGPYLRDESKTIADVLAEITAKIGERIVIARFSRIELGE
ncbi:elongation factor Ts [Candidatus Berkelbacteria bacterium]|nr:elongation factor Ts [Candidatus Berkelbacteria bacterium]